MPPPEPPAYSLGAEDSQALAVAAGLICRHDLVAEVEDYVLDAQIAAASLSDNLRRRLLTFRRFGDASGGMLIRGVPTGAALPTPAQATAGSAPVAAAALSVLVAPLGDQYGFRQELGGAIVQDILPMHGFESQQISVGSRVNLYAHVETAFSPLRSDFVALLCIRADRERRAGTTLSSVDAMLPLLEQRTVEILREPRFRTTVDASFLLGDRLSGEVWVDPICVLDGPTRRPRLRVDFGGTEGKDRAAQHAFEALREVAFAAQTIVCLDAGDLLLVDNSRAVHGRTPFTPRYDARDRWLLRTFVTRDLSRSEESRSADGRIVELDYV